jgi:DNA-binding LytR/AlgR family response regulator
MKVVMRMMNIAICDDDRAICSQIENVILDYSKRNCLTIDIGVFFTGETLLEHLNQCNVFDLIYLDIEMGEISGIEVGKQIRKVLKNYVTEIVYISGNDGYDRQLFDVQPLHFIPKPINSAIVIDDLKLAMERMRKLVRFFEFQKGHDTYKIAVHEILYFESLNREMKIVTTIKEDTFYGSLENVMLAVSGFGFLQIHRSYLINYSHASVVKYSKIVMSNGAELPISRAKQQQLRNLQLEED